MNAKIEQIVDACKRKEPMAQKRLYDDFASKMLGLCMRYTHSHDEAQDLLHDGFIKIFETIDTLHINSASHNHDYHRRRPPNLPPPTETERHLRTISKKILPYEGEFYKLNN